MIRRISFLFVLIWYLVSCTERTTDQNGHKNWTLDGFVKVDSINPILKPSHAQVFHCTIRDQIVGWEERNVLNPTVVVRDNVFFLIYRAQDDYMTSRLGLAISDDGLHFKKEPEPILFPQDDHMKVYEWPGGIEDPRIVESEDGLYILTYTAYDGKTARLCLASSRDLKQWTKHGLVLGGDKYKNTWSKSGAIVSRREGHRFVATKVDGKFWMYFGDTNIFMATSDDLIKWTVLENEENGNMISVLHPRSGYFDSRLVEPGPFALLQDTGILLIYNASNAANHNDPRLPKFTYAAGQALFDRMNPNKLIDRANDYFIYPNKDYEHVGEVNEVCFVEGLAHVATKWYLYYGTADSKIAVAVKN